MCELLSHGEIRADPHELVGHVVEKSTERSSLRYPHHVRRTWTLWVTCTGATGAGTTTIQGVEKNPCGGYPATPEMHPDWVHHMLKPTGSQVRPQTRRGGRASRKKQKHQWELQPGAWSRPKSISPSHRQTKRKLDSPWGGGFTPPPS